MSKMPTVAVPADVLVFLIRCAKTNSQAQCMPLDDLRALNAACLLEPKATRKIICHRSKQRDHDNQ